ncbi:MAG: response regulator transcription factor [Wenzhouxiangella sp.]|nr:response regulator transcription factor [Wenzhouxiangella sp.]
MSSQHVLIIDDDRELSEMLRDYLVSDGWQVDAAYSGTTGLELALSGEHDLVVLDIMLPGMNGLEVLRQLRNKSQIPVIMLTARGDDTDRIVGLELGADDYLPKPFNPRELSARLRAIGRRTASNAHPSRIQVGHLVIDHERREASIGGQALGLTAAEFALLSALAENHGEVVSKDELARLALGRELQAMDRSVDTHISRLRSKFPQSQYGLVEIQAVRGRGYVLTTVAS